MVRSAARAAETGEKQAPHYTLVRDSTVVLCRLLRTPDVQYFTALYPRPFFEGNETPGVPPKGFPEPVVL